jgi:hypothetical protein
MSEPRAARLAAIRERLEKATPGPWVPERTDASNVWFDSLPEMHVPIETRGTSFALGMAVGATTGPRDAVFVAAARDDVPWLLDEVDRLEHELFCLGEESAGLEVLLAAAEEREARLRQELAGIATLAREDTYMHACDMLDTIAVVASAALVLDPPAKPEGVA